MAARKRGRKTTRRRTKQGVNLVNAAQAGIVLNAMTTGLFNSNLIEFITGTQNGQFKAGTDGSFRLTMPELLGFTTSGWKASAVGGQYASGYDLGRVVSGNFKRNLGPMVATVVFVPAMFTVGKKLTSGPRRDVNKAFKMLGLKSVVKV